MAGRELDDPVELAVEERVARDNESAYVLGNDGRKCILEIAFATSVEHMDRLADSTSRSLHIAQQQLRFRLSGLMRTPMRAAAGTRSRASLSCFACSTGVSRAIPVVLT
jgi:hypothetical protein